MTERQLPLYEYWVEYMTGDTITKTAVTASYMQEDGRLIVFKDASHATVFGVAGNMLLSVTRKRLAESGRTEVQE